MSLRLSCTLLAPLYDLVAGPAFHAARRDSLALPFRDASFDCAVLHLILAVVPDAVRALAETARVVRAGGAILVQADPAGENVNDKPISYCLVFLRPWR